MGDQFAILTTLFEFFAFALLVAVSGVVLLVLLAWWDQSIKEFKPSPPSSPSKGRRRRAVMPLTKIA